MGYIIRLRFLFMAWKGNPGQWKNYLDCNLAAQYGSIVVACRSTRICSTEYYKRETLSIQVSFLGLSAGLSIPLDRHLKWQLLDSTGSVEYRQKLIYCVVETTCQPQRLPSLWWIITSTCAHNGRHSPSKRQRKSRLQQTQPQVNSS